MTFMKTTSLHLVAIVLSVGLFAWHGHASKVAVADEPQVEQGAAADGQEEAKLREKLHKHLAEARGELLKMNDTESVEFIDKMLTALDRTEQLSPEILKKARQRMADQVRTLARRGALESAATVNWAQWQMFFEPGPGADGPERTDGPTAGEPGPGGLVLYFPFDSPAEDGVVQDESGAGNDGRVEGAEWVPDGHIGGAYRFKITDVDDRIVVPDNDSLDVEQVTITAWIKSSDTDGFWNRIVDKDWRKGYNLCLGGDWNGKRWRGRLCAEFIGMASGRNRPFVGDGRWHFVAASYDGTNLKLYMDKQRRRKKAERPGPITKNNWDLCIGNSVVDYGTGEFLAFDGLIDEVRVYNRALSDDEIQTIAAATEAKVDIVDSPAKVDEGGAGIDGRLKKLKELYEQGLISKEVYDQKMKEVLDSL